MISRHSQILQFYYCLLTNGFLRYETELVHYFEDYYFDGKEDVFQQKP